MKNKFRKKYYPMNKSFYYVKKHNLELNFYKNKYYIKFQQSWLVLLKTSTWKVYTIQKQCNKY